MRPALSLTGAMILTLGACALTPPDPEPDAARGAALFADNCAACHGADAGGGVSVLDDRATPNLRRLSRRNGGVFPRDFVLSTIDGYTRDTASQSAMPEFGAGDLGPLVLVEDNGIATPIPADLLSLSLYLESVQD